MTMKTPSSQTQQRNENRYAILRGLHFEGPLQRSVMAAQYGIRKTSVTSIVQELLDRGIIGEETPGSLRSRLRLNARTVHVLTADVRTDGYRICRVFLDGSIEPVESRKFDFVPRPAPVLKAIADDLRTALSHRKSRVVGIGVAMPGVIDFKRKVNRFAANLPDWRDVEVGNELQSRLDCEVMIENDVRCQLWDAAWFGRLLASYENMMFVSVLNGVAGALIIHGKLIRGVRHSAGEFGCIKTGADGRACRNGIEDCLEGFASLPAMIADARRVCSDVSKNATGADLVRIARENPKVHDVIANAVGHLARVMVPAMQAIDPEILVLGSDDAELCRYMKPMLAEDLRVGGCLWLDDSRLVAGESAAASIPRGMAGLVIDDAFCRNILTVKEQHETATVPSTHDG